MDTVLLKKLLVDAEDFEMRARILQQQESGSTSCGIEYGNAACKGCTGTESCESLILGTQAEIQSLFENAWQAYHDVETQARESKEISDSIESCALLAQVLLDIHIHPNSEFVKDSNALWEAQYLWLHLFYRTGEQEYFLKAKLCDGIRHATIELIQQ